MGGEIGQRSRHLRASYRLLEDEMVGAPRGAAVRFAKARVR
jgi:hypothetical protein